MPILPQQSSQNFCIFCVAKDYRTPFRRPPLLNYVEAKMGMEGQIMCIEQCTFYMSSVAFLGPQNVPKSSAATDPTVGAYSASLDLLAGIFHVAKD